EPVVGSLDKRAIALDNLVPRSKPVGPTGWFVKPRWPELARRDLAKWTDVPGARQGIASQLAGADDQTAQGSRNASDQHGKRFVIELLWKILRYYGNRPLPQRQRISLMRKRNKSVWIVRKDAKLASLL